MIYFVWSNSRGVKFTIEAIVQRCSVKRCSYKFRKIHRKTPVPQSEENTSDRPRPATLLKKRLWHKCFLVNFVKFLRTPFFIEHLSWLLSSPAKNCSAMTSSLQTRVLILSKKVGYFFWVLMNSVKHC